MEATKRARIMIVEDDDDARYALRVRLRASGYDPVTAPNALYAMRLAQRESVDLVVLDLGLPDVDGIGLLRELHGEPSLANVPVVVVTARDAATAAVAAHEAGAFAFLQKPVETQVLKETISRALFFRRVGALRGGVLPPAERPAPLGAGQ